MTKSKIKKLFTEPFKYWPDAKACFTRHQNTKSRLHSDASTIYSSFLSSVSGKSQSIDVLINDSRRAKIADNRKKLMPIIDTIILCGRQCLPLKGHRDDSQHHAEVGELSDGRTRNFLELLNYRVHGGDEVLAEHLKKCPKNATYISKTTQNDLIKCCGDFILDTITSEVKKNKFFTILADEASDCSNKEQMSLVLRFVDSDLNIREDFVKFIHCKEGWTGFDLANLISNAITDLGIDIQNCRGQGYDGAGAVSGHTKGLSARILGINRKALYKVQPVRNMMDHVKDVSYFYNLSQTRQQCLELHVGEHCPGIKRKKLKDVYRTRWMERISGLDVFEELFVAIVFSLSAMDINVDRKYNAATSSKAHSFLKLFTPFDFIVSLVITS